MYYMRLRDENMLEMFAHKMLARQYTQVNHVTNMLYWFAKFKWRSSQGDEYLKVALNVLLSEP